MMIKIELKDGRLVTPEEHYIILCKRHGLSGTKPIKRDPKDRECWIEHDTEYVEGAEIALEEDCSLPGAG